VFHLHKKLLLRKRGDFVKSWTNKKAPLMPQSRQRGTKTFRESEILFPSTEDADLREKERKLSRPLAVKMFKSTVFRNGKGAT